MRSFLYSISLLLLISCDSFLSKEYKRYQTFDEYRLKGISFNDHSIHYACVFIKERKDSIIVVPSIDKSRKITYLRCGDYWYCFEHQHVEAEPNIKSEAYDRYFYKYIFNDTLMVCSYDIIDGKQSTIEIDVETKYSNINIYTNETFSLVFNKLKYIARNYKSIYSQYWFEPNFHNNSYYIAYNKEIKGNKIYYYLQSPSGKKRDPEIYDLGDLGEFSISCYGLNSLHSR
jgi:hypothetical protein